MKTRFSKQSSANITKLMSLSKAEQLEIVGII